MSVQILLETGHFIAHLDARNAHNACNRRAAFDYFLSKRHLYKQSFRLFNALYAVETHATWFAPGGEPVMQTTVSGGSRQGDVPASLIYIASTYDLPPSNSILLADDTYIFSHSLQSLHLQMLQTAEKYRGQGLEILGPKTVVIAPADITPSFQFVEAAHSAYVDGCSAVIACTNALLICHAM